MIVTVRDVERLIQESKEAGADPSEIQKLQEHLAHLKSKGLKSQATATFGYEKVESDGSRTVYFSTAPLSPEHNEDFEQVTFKPVDGK